MMRNTVQKQRILEYIRGTKEHPTAFDVFSALKDEIPGLTLATVYRNLNTLADKGIILRFEVNKQYHYDYNTTPHYHVVCDGKIYDVFSDEINQFLNKKMKEFKLDSNCQINRYSLIFYK